MVGAGAIAQSYAHVFRSSQTAELVAVADVDLDAATTVADLFGCRIFDSHGSLLRAGGFEAALVCTTPSSHASISLDFLRSGVHVLCEQPLSTDVGSARRMLHVADRNGVTLTMASKFRYVGDVIQAKAFIEAGLLGDILTFENSFASRVNMVGRWYANRAISGGGVIIADGTHSLDILRYLCGPITAIAAYEGARAQNLMVEDTAHLVARTKSGALASIDLSWSCDLDSDHYLRVYGVDGGLTLGWARSRYRHGNNRSWITFGSGYNESEALSTEIDNFCRALRGEEPLLISAQESLASVEAIAAAYRSLRGDRWISVEDESTHDVTFSSLAPVSVAR